MGCLPAKQAVYPTSIEYDEASCERISDVSLSPTKKGYNEHLLDAVITGKVDNIAALILNGAVVDWFDDTDGMTGLMLAAEKGRIECIKELCSNGAHVNRRNDVDKGKTALSYASEMGHEKAIQLLVLLGADVNIQISRTGETVLMAACKRGHIGLLKTYLQNADVNITDIRGKTGLHYACEMGHTLVRRASSGLLENDNAYPGGKHLECIEALCSVGANVNLKVL